MFFADFAVVASFMDGKNVGSDGSLLLSAEKDLSNN